MSLQKEQTSNKAKILRVVAPAGSTSESHETESDDVNTASPMVSRVERSATRPIAAANIPSEKSASGLKRVSREHQEGIPADDWTEIVFDSLRYDGDVNAATSDSTTASLPPATPTSSVSGNPSMTSTQGTFTTPALQTTNETPSASTPRVISNSQSVRRPLIPTAPTTILQKTPSPVARQQLSMASRPPSVRPARPTGDSSQAMHVLNMVSEQLRDVQRQNEEIKRTLQATNKRQTNLEIAILRLEKKIDTSLSQRIQEPTPVTTATTHQDGGVTLSGSLLAPVPRVESIPEDLVLGEEVLQSALNCAKSGKHFATLILKSVWPELFGPQQRRMAYNWNGTRGKTPLDERRKRVVEIYTHFYFPETRHQKVWSDVVGRINERMRRQWRKKSSQRHEAHGESSGEEDGENRDPNGRVLTSVDQNDDLLEIPETMNFSNSFSYLDYLEM